MKICYMHITFIVRRLKKGFTVTYQVFVVAFPAFFWSLICNTLINCCFGHQNDTSNFKELKLTLILFIVLCTLTCCIILHEIFVAFNFASLANSLIYFMWQNNPAVLYYPIIFLHHYRNKLMNVINFKLFP